MVMNEDSQVLEDNVKRWFFERFHLFNHSIKYTGLNGAVSPSTLTLVSTFSNLHSVTEIDLTGSLPGNDLRYLENVQSLQSLILDSCCLNDHFICPSIHSLGILSFSLALDNVPQGSSTLAFWEILFALIHVFLPTGLNGAVSPSTLTLVSTFSNLHSVTEIDLTGSLPGNDLRYLENVQSLQSLILDSCCLNDHFICPSIHSLGILSSIPTNKQELKSQPEWILEMELDYLRYRQFVISHGSLPHLQFLDAQAVSKRERQTNPAVVGKAVVVETFQSPIGPQGLSPPSRSRGRNQGPPAHQESSIQPPGGLRNLVWQLWNSTKYEWGLVDHASPHGKQAQPTQILEMCEIRGQNPRRHYQVESAPIHDLILWEEDDARARPSTHPLPRSDQPNEEPANRASIMDAPYAPALQKPGRSTHRKADNEQEGSGGKSFFGKLRYRYSGKNSEGNRFIRNHDL
ncbi:hypothetical protein TCAL_10270 [Tigriopus californicus]|uniref:Uncharacterized protein n=1 Tax=Tigriopus californicus TaxID=6832 RepID=A0A553PNI8_TIGCA|nr:hypothetical protein TCAL_10270 [Tigriopus californicus]